jgi:hypothetical protein
MSETPQTPPPPEPPPAGSGQPSFNADQMKSAVQGADPYDLGIIAAGVLAFIFSLFSYYKYSFSFSGLSTSGTFSAWHGFFGWFAAVVALAASLALAAALFGKVSLPFPLRLSVLGAYGLAGVCVILALFVVPGGDVSGTGIDKGHGFSYWISLIVILAGLGLSFMRKDAEA